MDQPVTEFLEARDRHETLAVRGTQPRVAIVHDYLYTIGGAERVLLAILRCFPQADLFTLFDVLPDAARERAGLPRSRTSFLQRMPLIAKKHRLYLPLMPIAIEQFDLSNYDVVISSSYVAAKGVITGPDQVHVSYVHSPMRYAWDLQEQYLREAGLVRGIKGALARSLLHYLRLWDSRTARGVDAFIANSHFVARRMRKVYGVPAQVLHPPVDVPATLPQVERGDHFLAASRLVPYKNIRQIAEAFRLLPDQRLLIAGTGPEAERIAALRIPNVELLGYVSDERMKQLMASARAFVFAAEEDFGIIPVEAQGQGTPVIALGRGGSRETVVIGGAAPTGLFFDMPEPASIASAIREFIAVERRFTREACHANASRFVERFFSEGLLRVVEQARRQRDGEIDSSLAGAAALRAAAE